MFDREPREKVRLYRKLALAKDWRFTDPPHDPPADLTIRPYQIFGYFSLFGKPPTSPSARGLVDTGAMLTLLPKDIWKPYQTQIRWLETTDNSFAATKIGGKSLSFRLGL